MQLLQPLSLLPTTPPMRIGLAGNATLTWPRSQETSGKSMRSNHCKKSRFCIKSNYISFLPGWIEGIFGRLPCSTAFWVQGDVTSPEITQNGPLKMVIFFLAAWMGSLWLIISWTAPLQLPPMSVRFQNFGQIIGKKWTLIQVLQIARTTKS